MHRVYEHFGQVSVCSKPPAWSAQPVSPIGLVLALSWTMYTQCLAKNTYMINTLIGAFKEGHNYNITHNRIQSMYALCVKQSLR